MTHSSPSESELNSDSEPMTFMVSIKGLGRAAIELSLLSILVAGLSTLFARSFWIADLAANLRVQLALAGFASIMICWITRRRYWLVIQIMLLALHLSWLVPSSSVASGSPAPATLTVSSANVFIHNHDYQAIRNVLVESPADVIAVFEISDALCQYLMQPLSETHPFVQAHPLPHPFGVVVFSRYPLQNVRTIGLDHTGGSMLFSVEANGHRYRIAAVHPISPMSAADFAARHVHLQLAEEDLLDWRRENADGSVVMIGDFNLTPWSPWFADLLQSSQLKHVVTRSRTEPSWYAWPLFPFGLVLDHCLVSPDLQCVSAEYGPSVRSDHRPLVVGLTSRR